MRRILGLLSIRRLSGQLAALLLVALCIGQIAAASLDYMRRSQLEAAFPPTTVLALATGMHLVADAESPEQQALLIAALNRQYPELDLAPTDAAGAAATPAGFAVSVFQRALGPDFIIDIGEAAIADRSSPATIVITTPDGQRFSAVLTRPPAVEPGSADMAILLAAFAVFGIVLCVVWVVRSIARPVTSLARAAAAVDLDASHQQTLAEEGPWELRTVSRAFNTLLRRMSLLLRSKTIALTAIGHDLRTPITRMRLRAEQIGDTNLRAGIVRDLDHMASIVTNVLRIVSDDEDRSLHETLDIAALLETICADFSDQGHDVTYVGPDALATRGSPDELSRLFTNLVANATRFGSKVVVRLEQNGDLPTVLVEDDGPGIPTSRREIVLQPFVRGGEERGGDGVGLGLAIAQAIAAAHKARLDLGESPMGGLAARVRFSAEV